MSVRCDVRFQQDIPVTWLSGEFVHNLAICGGNQKGMAEQNATNPAVWVKNPRWTFIWFWSRDELLMFKIYNLVSSHMGKPWCVFKSGEKNNCQEMNEPFFFQ